MYMHVSYCRNMHIHKNKPLRFTLETYKYIIYIIPNDTIDTNIPDIIFPIKTPKIASFILIFNKDAIAEVVQTPVVGSGIATNIIIPKIDTLFNFFIRLFIFSSIIYPIL